jgi:hypothetical protein
MHMTAGKVVQRYLTAGYLNIGDLILYGKFKNARGRITGFGKSEKGDPTILVQPVDKEGKPKKSQPKELVMLKIRKVVPPKKEAGTEFPQPAVVVEGMNSMNDNNDSTIAARIAARTINALGEGRTFENEAWRIHRYRPSIKITELVNAGKRGKKVQQIDLYDLDYVQGGFPTESVAAELVMLAKRGASFDRMLQAAKEAKELGAQLQISTERGVDVRPGGFEEITVKGKGVLVEVGYKSFSVQDIADQNNLSTCIPAIKGGKKSIPAFYRWVKDNQAKIRGMKFHEVVKAMDENGIDYHRYCAMD